MILLSILVVSVDVHVEGGIN